ncbi:Von Willebrand factor type A domain protein [Enhygromyxa salina]|uniref:von Willebrand factor type A domain protein n=1 Tax=Enhygromyxa salina TaxID=215803 RepID=A0A0C2A149_9BACT|nr:AgmX/PglI C-terminal domain-containing protein [Enhygromyxa salina]KIG17123.1 Von Willebrand factor type A domain protein [Enhygromyxa salina]
MISCGATEPTLAATAQDRPPPPNLEINVVQHRPASLVPRVDWRASAIERAPMALTAGDGTGLRLVSVTGTVVIADPLAFTELHLTFENPESRRREGRFEFDLPPGAALSRLAMQIGKRWMEGEVVERSAGRRTFETYVHDRPRVDPALLEQSGANRVSARVFPIQPRERKQIIISYSQPLIGGDESYRLPLQGLPELDALDVRVIVKTIAEHGASQRVVEVNERSFAPKRDLIVALDGGQDAGALRADELVAVRVRPRLADADSVDPVDGLTVLFDTSASSAQGYDREVDRLGAMLQALGDVPVRVVAFDQTVSLIHDGPAAGALGDPLASLRARRGFGASDLHAALSHAVVRTASSRRLLIWSDGIATAGEVEGAALVAVAQTLHFTRIDAYASSTSADRALLGTLASAATRAGFVVGPDLAGAELVESLARPGFDAVEVRVAGADWSYPRSLEGFAPGDDVVVVASFPHAAPEEVYVGFSDPRLPDHVVPTSDAAVPLVLRAVARARVDELQQQLEHSKSPAEAAQLREHLVELAVDNRLLTPHTALLVLESEAEYRRYGIQRAGRSDILTVGPKGVELVRRGGRASASADDDRLADAREPEDAIDEVSRDAGVLGVLGQAGNGDAEVWGGLTGEVGEALGAGGLGLVGTGRGGGGGGEGTIGLGNTELIGKGASEGTIGIGNSGLIGNGGGGGTGAGYGRGSGAGFGGRGVRVPAVRQAAATVSGSLDKDIIRRVVRSRINEVRHCYNAGLMRNPNLAGRVEVQFVIDERGSVDAASVASSSLEDQQVATCIANATRRWRFPKPPGGGSVIVKYPFMLDPGGATMASSWRPAASRAPRRRPGDPSDANGAKWAGSAQSGRYGSLRDLVANGQFEQAQTKAWDWATTEPDNALALVALGELLELDGQRELAARVYGSLIDLHPERADMRRAASARLEALDESARALAIDSFRKAVEQRPDQINGHRQLAWALAKDRRYEQAFEVLGDAIDTPIPAGRFNGVKALLREDRELIAAAWLASEVTGQLALEARLRAAGVRPATAASLRLVANWETDATDVDILVVPEGRGDGRRHADVRTGFGPEAWISSAGRCPEAVNARVRYFNRGAMGYALGTVSSVAHDGAGNLSFHERPFVLMNGEGSVELGRFGA